MLNVKKNYSINVFILFISVQILRIYFNLIYYSKNSNFYFILFFY